MLRVGSVVKLFVPEKVLLPENVFELASRVVEATTMFAVPLKETPLIVRAVSRAVAVPAFPPIEREEVATSSRAVPAEFVYNILFPVIEERPVPPFAMGRTPVR